MPTSSTEWWKSTCVSPFAGDGKVEPRVHRQQFEHMVEKADAGIDFGPAGAVLLQRERDIRFARFALDGCTAHTIPFAAAIRGRFSE